VWFVGYAKLQRVLHATKFSMANVHLRILRSTSTQTRLSGWLLDSRYDLKYKIFVLPNLEIDGMFEKDLESAARGNNQI